MNKIQALVSALKKSDRCTPKLIDEENKFYWILGINSNTWIIFFYVPKMNQIFSYMPTIFKPGELVELPLQTCCRLLFDQYFKRYQYCHLTHWSCAFCSYQGLKNCVGVRSIHTDALVQIFFSKLITRFLRCAVAMVIEIYEDVCTFWPACLLVCI